MTFFLIHGSSVGPKMTFFVIRSNSVGQNDFFGIQCTSMGGKMIIFGIMSTFSGKKWFFSAYKAVLGTKNDFFPHINQFCENDLKGTSVDFFCHKVISSDPNITHKSTSWLGLGSPRPPSWGDMETHGRQGRNNELTANSGKRVLNSEGEMMISHSLVKAFSIIDFNYISNLFIRIYWKNPLYF